MPSPPGPVVTTYYYVGGQRIAMRERTATTDVLTYLHGDHLGSASLATDANGAKINATHAASLRSLGGLGQVRYYPYGETRSGDMATDRRYTGQRFEADLGLYDYHARYYDPTLGRFISADTIVPNPGDPQSLNRYAYANNSPMLYVDPDGHFPLAVALILLIAGGGFIGDWSFQVAGNSSEGMNFWDATNHQNVDLAQSAQTAAVAGSVAATVVTAGPAVVAGGGQVLMGAGMATGSTTLWTAGTSTVAWVGGTAAALAAPIGRSTRSSSPYASRLVSSQHRGFSSIQNRAGASVWISDRGINQDNFAPIVDDTLMGGESVSIYSGCHGNMPGQFAREYGVRGTIIPEVAFFRQDVARWGSNPNVTVWDMSNLGQTEFSMLLNGQGVHVCAWCYSQSNDWGYNALQ